MKKANLEILVNKNSNQIPNSKNNVIIKFPVFQNTEFVINLILEQLNMNYYDYSKIDKFSKLSEFLKLRKIDVIVINNIENMMFWGVNDLRILFSVLSESLNNREVYFYLDYSKFEELLLKEDELKFMFEFNKQNIDSQSKIFFKERVKILFKYFDFTKKNKNNINTYEHIENLDLILK